MAIFTNDSMADTAGTSLTSHTGSVGATWSTAVGFGSSAAAITNANRVRGNASGNNLFYASGVPASADMDVELDLYVASAVDAVGVLLRCSTTADTRYLCYFSLAGQSITIYSQVNGSQTGSSSTASYTFTAGQTYHVRCVARGTALVVLINGVQVLYWTDGNNAAAGRAGLYFFGAETNTTGGHVSNLIASTVATTAVTSSNLQFSPYNTNSDGGGSMGSNNVLGSSTFARSQNPGWYCKINPTFASNGLLSLVLDTAPLSGITAGNCPTLSVTINGQAATNYLLAYSANPTRLQIATGQSAANLPIQVDFKSVGTSGNNFGDRWNALGTAPASVVKLLGVETDGRGTTLAAPTMLTKNAIFFAESMGEGADAVGSSNANGDQDATQAFTRLIATGLGCEVGVIAYSAQGYAWAGYGNVAKLYDTGTPANSTWNQYYSGASRLIAAKLSPIPDYVLIHHGTNDSANSVADATVTATVQALITAIRTAVNATTPIFILMPFNPNYSGKNTAIKTGVTNAADAYTYVIDLGTFQQMVSGGAWTNDGIHPNGTRGHPNVSVQFLKQVMAKLSLPTGSRRAR